MANTIGTEKLAELDQAIQKFVRPDTLPLAIRVMKPDEKLPQILCFFILDNYKNYSQLVKYLFSVFETFIDEPRLTK